MVFTRDPLLIWNTVMDLTVISNERNERRGLSSFNFVISVNYAEQLCLVNVEHHDDT